MSGKSRKKSSDIAAGIVLLVLIGFLSGRIFCAGWDEFSARTEFIGVSQPACELGDVDRTRAALVPGGSMVADPPSLWAADPPPSAEAGGRLDIRCLAYFQRAYPDVNFARSWDPLLEDWLITLTVPADGRGSKVRTTDLYWVGGAMIPADELANADSYRPVFYDYPKELADPAAMTEEEREAIRRYSSAENRRNGAGTSMFFFDFLYQSDTRGHLEAHLTSISFLKHRANVHERMTGPLARVEKRILDLADRDREVAAFLAGIKSNDSYLWRIIAGTRRKS
ncbi:MAG: hypothetical protein II932_03170, partial [Treponema sp.]|nr:hypothetical protein [Treponema sp.]